MQYLTQCSKNSSIAILNGEQIITNIIQAIELLPIKLDEKLPEYNFIVQLIQLIGTYAGQLLECSLLAILRKASMFCIGVFVYNTGNLIRNMAIKSLHKLATGTNSNCHLRQFICEPFATKILPIVAAENIPNIMYTFVELLHLCCKTNFDLIIPNYYKLAQYGATKQAENTFDESSRIIPLIICYQPVVHYTQIEPFIAKVVKKKQRDILALFAMSFPIQCAQHFVSVISTLDWKQTQDKSIHLFQIAVCKVMQMDPTLFINNYEGHAWISNALCMQRKCDHSVKWATVMALCSFKRHCNEAWQEMISKNTEDLLMYQHYCRSISVFLVIPSAFADVVLQ